MRRVTFHWWVDSLFDRFNKAVICICAGHICGQSHTKKVEGAKIRDEMIYDFFCTIWNFLIGFVTIFLMDSERLPKFWFVSLTKSNLYYLEMYFENLHTHKLLYSLQFKIYQDISVTIKWNWLATRQKECREPCSDNLIQGID